MVRWSALAVIRMAPFILAMAASGCNQIDLARLYFANNSKDVETTQSLPITLPYQDHKGWVVLPARINGKAPVDFVLDTGAAMLTIIASEKTQHLGFDMRNVHRLGSEDDLAAPTGARQDGLNIDFGGLILKDHTAIAMPFKSIQCIDKVVNPPFQGVLGYELFRRYTIEVNRDRGVVVIHDPDTYRYTGKGQIVPIEIDSRQPYMTATVTPPTGPAYKARFHLDSGADTDLSLFPATNPAIKVPAEGEEKSSCFAGGKGTYRIGAPVTLTFAGKAITTPVRYAIGNENSADGRNGRIGIRFLQNYNMIIDYARERIILEPRVAKTEA